MVTVERLLTTTRAVRRRMDFSRPVDPAVVRDCIRLAIHSPNARNEQDWRWIVVTNPELRMRLSAAIRAPGGTPGRATHRTAPQAVRDSARYLLDHLAEVPVFVFAGLVGNLADDASHLARADFYGSLLPAVWSFQLALRAHGLGSVLTTRFLSHEHAIAELLGTPADLTLMAMIPVAHYRGRLTPPPRGDVDEVVHWERWGGVR